MFPPEITGPLTDLLKCSPGQPSSPVSPSLVICSDALHRRPGWPGSEMTCPFTSPHPNSLRSAREVTSQQILQCFTIQYSTLLHPLQCQLPLCWYDCVHATASSGVSGALGAHPQCTRAALGSRGVAGSGEKPRTALRKHIDLTLKSPN